jgi:hypothetical protein
MRIISEQTPSQELDHKFYSEGLTNSYLIQKLKSPIPLKENTDEWLHKTFKFGGRTSELGGFDRNFAIKLGKICSFYGMGSSQYEWGAVPRAFLYLYEKNLETQFKFINFEYKVPSSSVPIYVICRKCHSKSVKFRLRALSESDDFRVLSKKVGLKLRDRCNLKQSLEDIFYGRTPEFVGWIELYNPYFFFLDKNMYEEFLNLFKVNSVDFMKRILR